MVGRGSVLGGSAPVLIVGSCVVVSVGVSPNPLIPQSVEGLEVTKWGTVVVDNNTMQSAVPVIFAGGDIVRGGATVILAMGDGRRAAKSMDEWIKNS